MRGSSMIFWCSIEGEYRAPFISVLDLLMSRTCKVPEPTPRIVRLHFWTLLLCLLLLLGATGESGESERPPTPVESVPVIPGPLPTPQEQLLTPIPAQFDWMRRTVRPNPLLEPLMRLRQVTPRLLMS